MVLTRYEVDGHGIFRNPWMTYDCMKEVWELDEIQLWVFETRRLAAPSEYGIDVPENFIFWFTTKGTERHRLFIDLTIAYLKAAGHEVKAYVGEFGLHECILIEDGEPDQAMTPDYLKESHTKFIFDM